MSERIDIATLTEVLDYWRTSMLKAWVKGKGLPTDLVANSLIADYERVRTQRRRESGASET